MKEAERNASVLSVNLGVSALLAAAEIRRWTLGVGRSTFAALNEFALVSVVFCRAKTNSRRRELAGACFSQRWR